MPAFLPGRIRLVFFALACALWCCSREARAQVPTAPLRGYLTAHDPSTITQCKNRYYVFYTGQGIQSKSSADKIFWTPGPAVFTNVPSWTTNAVPGFAGIFWAPDVLYFNNQYHLWYAVSTFGSQVSGIGLVTNPTLDPSDPSYHWTDQGPVITSTNGSPYNTIDPSFTWDAAGNLWMAFGSYWNGIYLVQLNATTGLRISPSSPTYNLAYNSSIEASYIYRRGGYYYLFVNWGSCCSGVDSTYNIRVGRSTSVTGPYRDKNGVNMVNNGGTLFQEGTGKFTGPGHVGILSAGGKQWWSYHYYDANAWAPQYNAYGAPDLSFEPLSWTSDNWPVFTNDWCALYKFQGDAREENSQYYGLLRNGASIRTNATYGHVLNLNGTNQYVWLPPGVGYGQTFAAVVNWRGGAAWQRIFDFGVDTSATAMLTAASSDNVLRCDINPGGNLQTVQWTQPLPTNVWTHVAVTLDGTQGILYVNGLPVATNTSMNLLPVNVAPQTNALGQSKFTADPYFNGQYAAFRVYGRALSPAEILAPVVEMTQPANYSAYSPGESISFAGAATDFAAAPLGASNLTWQINYVQDGMTNVVFGPVAGITNGAFSVPTNATGGGNYEFLLTATDSSSRTNTVTATVVPANPPTSWSSYFPLKSNVVDVNGHYNGTLQGGASFVNDITRGNVLSLTGTNQYVRFPAGLSGMQTFMAWVKWNGGAAWQRIYDFGNDTNFYSVLTPEASSGDLRFNISVDSIPGEQVIDAPGPLPVGVWAHVAVVMNGTSVVLYTNGIPVGTNLYANLVPANLNATNIYLGRSQWPTDPYFSGELSDVRIYSRPLASNEITAPQITISQPAQGAVYNPGDVISFSGSANDFFDAAIPSANLVWSVNFVNGAATNTVDGPLTNVSGAAYQIPFNVSTNGSYQFVLQATDSSGRSATNMVSIYPAAAVGPSSWASFYPFSAGAQDSSNLFNGALVGGASVVSDLTRGKVLSLSGSSQYVNLPSGAGGAETISGWVKWSGGSEWARIFDFGQNNQDYFFLTPADASALPQCSITTDIAIYNQEIEGPTTFPINQWTQFAVVMDGREGVLYINGSAVAVNNSVNLLPSDVSALTCYLGRSHYPADPYFSGLMDSVALNSMAILPSQLVAPLPAIVTPTNGTRFSGGATLAFSGVATDFAGNALPAGSFSWSGQLDSNGVVTPVFGPINGVTSGSYPVPTNGPYATNAFYTVNLTVTDTNGNQQTASANVPALTGQLNLATIPAGLQVMMDGSPVTTPASMEEVVGMNHVVNAPSPQNFSGSNYSFVLWSDGGAVTHDFLAPAGNFVLTASFVEPTISGAFGTSGFNLSWPQWAGSLSLYGATNLAPPAAWTPVTNAPILSNGLLTVTVPVTNSMEFFRLQSQ